MNNNVIPFPQTEVRNCCACGAAGAQLTYEVESFLHGIGENQVMLKARVPVITCDICHCQMTDGSAEEIRHAEVCRHLGRLTPEAVRAIRERYGLSQNDWAKRTGFGIASVKRWEAGNLIQNEAMDRYLRLLISPENFAKVSLMDGPSARETHFRFQTTLSDSVVQGEASFHLRKSLMS